MNWLFTRPIAGLPRATNEQLGRPTPLSNYRHGTPCQVVASNWGKDVPLHWLLNLNKQPAEAGEQKRLWQPATKHNPQFLNEQNHTARPMAPVLLTPLAA